MCVDTKSDVYSKKINCNLPENTYGRYLTRLELEQFKIDCPMCEYTVNLLDFSEHFKEDVAEIRAKYEHTD